jgi:aminopeptidase N
MSAAQFFLQFLRRQFARWLRPVFMVACLAWSWAALAAPFAFHTTPGKLPKHVIPLEYKLALQPDLARHQFKGVLEIQIQVTRPVNRIVMNALDLQIDRASVSAAGGATQTLTARLDPLQETLSFHLARALQPGLYRLHIDYRGKINRQPHGLYYDTYPTATGEKQMLATEMEPTDARRLLPCWDEPAFRAVFQLTVDLPANFSAFSNTPIAEQLILPSGKRMVFEPTPKMASYLLVLAAGELERNSVDQDGVEIGLITTEGKQAGAAYALQASRDLLHYYNNYFGMRYPLRKLDHIAVPNGYGGAMENWGGIIYSEDTVLYDPKKDSQETKRQVFDIVAHETAHQWFGNLVTMAWWDDLWLNEGFASWMASKASAQLNPDWPVWLEQQSAKNAAMEQDMMEQTHPVQQPVRNEAQANDAFDGITYAKGQSVLRMLEQYLGEEAFQRGMQTYLTRHQYSNTTSADLWAALSTSADRPVAVMAQTWTSQAGFPLISVSERCVNGQRQIQLSQQQFKANGKKSSRIWPIPVQFQVLTTAQESSRPPAQSETVLLNGTSLNLTFPHCQGVLLIDPQDIGFYRVQYSEGMWQQLMQQWPQLPDSLRLKILSDTWALVTVGRLPLAQYLGLLPRIQLQPQTSRLALWDQMFAALDQLETINQGQAGQGAWRNYLQQLLQIHFDRLGWQTRSDDSQERNLLRARLVAQLARLDHPDFIAQGQAHFAQWLQEPDSLSPGLQEAVLGLAARHADQARYDQIRKMAQNALGSTEKAQFYHALTLVKNPQLAQQTLNLTLSPKLPTQTFATLLYGMAQDQHRDLTWRFLQKNRMALFGTQSERERQRMASNVLAGADELRYLSQLERFTKAWLGKEAVQELEMAAESIRFNAARKAKLLPQLRDFLREFAKLGRDLPQDLPQGLLKK